MEHALHVPPVEGGGEGLRQQQEEQKGEEGHQEVAQEEFKEEAHPGP